MFTLIKAVEVYSPAFLGKKDVLVAFDKIAAIEDSLTYSALPSLSVVNGEGKLLLPGFIDNHVHITGGGGEGGFSTRTPEVTAAHLLQNGITTVVGVLGTDGVTRSLENLYAKARELEEQELTAYIYTGSYQVPAVTLTGSIQRDLILIDKVIGAGEIAISDHRSFQPTFSELSRLAAEARVGGMLAGKSGIVNLHLGDFEEGLALLNRLIQETPIPRVQFLPTHVNRNRRLLNEALQYALEGGNIDLTAGFEQGNSEDDCIPAYEAMKLLFDAGVNDTRITLSSDGNGSKPVFNAEGQLVRIEASSCRVLLEEIRYAVSYCDIPLERALKTITSNPARILHLDGCKGTLQAGLHADMVLLDEQLQIDTVWAKGRRVHKY